MGCASMADFVKVSIFLTDLQRSRELTLEVHRARSFRERLREFVVSLVVPLL